MAASQARKMKILIINADDMGVSQAVNNAVISLYKASAITGTSVIAVGDAFPEACRLLRDNGIKEAGVHITLTGKFKPVTFENPEIKGLLSKQGYFPRDYFFLSSKCSLGKIKKQALRAEMYAQIEKVKREGLTVTHLDGHEHVHMMPWVLDIALELCVEFSIPYIRIPVESPLVFRISFKVKDLIRYGALKLFSIKAKRKVPKVAVCSNSAFLGHFHSGRLNRKILLSLADTITDGITELAVHPSENSPLFFKSFPWYRNGTVEVEALKSEEWKDKLNSLGISPISHSKASENSRNALQGNILY